MDYVPVRALWQSILWLPSDESLGKTYFKLPIAADESHQFIGIYYNIYLKN